MKKQINLSKIKKRLVSIRNLSYYDNKQEQLKIAKEIASMGLSDNDEKLILKDISDMLMTGTFLSRRRRSLSYADNHKYAVKIAKHIDSLNLGGDDKEKEFVNEIANILIDGTMLSKNIGLSSKKKSNQRSRNLSNNLSGTIIPNDNYDVSVSYVDGRTFFKDLFDKKYLHQYIVVYDSQLETKEYLFINDIGEIYSYGKNLLGHIDNVSLGDILESVPELNNPNKDLWIKIYK
jgi:hypothetical protein